MTLNKKTENMSATTRQSIKPNPSRKVQYILGICVGILLFFTVQVSWGQAPSFDEEINLDHHLAQEGETYSVE